MRQVGTNKAVLLLRSGVVRCDTRVRFVRVMVIVAPFSLQTALMRMDSRYRNLTTYEVVGKLEAGQVSVGVLKVDHYKLLVFVRRHKQRRLARRLHPENVAVLGL